MSATITLDGPVATLTLRAPRGNAISFGLLDGLAAVLDELERDRPRALVVTGSGRTFSGGLDLVEAYDHDPATLRRFVDGFEEMFARFFALPFPTVAAVNGHAIAGGMILMLACDVRIVADAPLGLALNEVKLGIPLPSTALAVARHALPSSSWTDALLEGRRYTPQEALAARFVDAVVPAEQLLAAAHSRACALAEAPSAAVAAVKRDLKRDVLARAAADADESRARFIEAWCAPDARARIGDVRASLLARTR